MLCREFRRFGGPVGFVKGLDFLGLKYAFLGVDIVLLLKITEIVVKRSALIHHFFEVSHAYGHRAHAGRQPEVGRRGHDLTVVVEFPEICKSADDNHAEASEVHLFEIKIFDNKRFEVMPGDFEKQFVGWHLGGIEYHHKHL